MDALTESSLHSENMSEGAFLHVAAKNHRNTFKPGDMCCLSFKRSYKLRHAFEFELQFFGLVSTFLSVNLQTLFWAGLVL